MRRSADPITIAIVVVLALVFLRIWKHVTNYMHLDEGGMFSAAEILFGAFLLLLAVGVGMRFGVKAVFGV